jgi:N-dimethylarginine dimethylaminohydrolase
MCRPEFYGIKYEINPWMDVNRQTLTSRAQKQWQELYRIITEVLGQTVELIQPQPDLPDIVFTANAGLVFDHQVVLSNFRYKERQRESPLFEAFFKDKRYKIFRLPGGVAFEGAGDALFCGQELFAGYIFRSEARCHSRLAEIVGKRVLSLELVDPRFYHLDTCFCPLAEGSALYYPGAFDSYARRILENYLTDGIVASREEALSFACNAVTVGKNIILGAHCPKLAAQLEDRGYRVFQLDLSEFMKAGGSAKCLTLEI